jgi:hypothetical protein
MDHESKLIYQQCLDLEESKLCVVGTPLIDRVVHKFQKAKSEYKTQRESKSLKVFLALQTTPVEINYKMITTTIEALSINNIHELTIGFHPGEIDDNKEILFQKLADAPININFIHSDSNW